MPAEGRFGSLVRVHDTKLGDSNRSIVDRGGRSIRADDDLNGWIWQKPPHGLDQAMPVKTP